MSEYEKIKKLITEHKALFDVTDMDVAESIKGQWFFSRYNKEMDYYEALVRFETAEELAEIMVGELSTDIFVSIDSAPEDPPERRNLANDLDMESTYLPHVERLIEYLNK